MNKELKEALDILEKEKEISKETLFEAIENSLITACKNHFGKADNVKVEMNPDTCEFHVYAEKTVVEEVEDPVMEISLANAKMLDSKYELGDVVNVEIKSKEFGRIATQNAKNVILQKIREAFEYDSQIEIVNIGDSVRARRIIDGTEEGRNILNTLSKRGYL